MINYRGRIETNGYYVRNVSKFPISFFVVNHCTVKPLYIGPSVYRNSILSKPDKGPKFFIGPSTVRFHCITTLCLQLEIPKKLT